MLVRLEISIVKNKCEK